jgi:hypothetical protein
MQTSPRRSAKTPPTAIGRRPPWSHRYIGPVFRCDASQHVRPHPLQCRTTISSCLSPPFLGTQHIHTPPFEANESCI